MISVIVPVYNVERYLSDCVDSILAQTLQEFELLLIDDGSTDRSALLCDEYAAKDPRIRVFHQENKGQSAARNFGIAHARGEWVCFVDSDDLIHPQMLEILYHAVQETNSLISSCDFVEGDKPEISFWSKQTASITTKTVNEDSLYNWFFHLDPSVSKALYWAVCGKLVAIDLVKEYPFTEGRIYEDNGLAFKWIAETRHVAYSDNPLYFYYKNTEGTTKKPYSVKRLDWLWAMQEQISYYHDKNYRKLELALRKRYIWEALREYDHIRLELNDKSLLRRVRLHIIQYLLKNNKSVPFSRSDIAEIVSRLYPKLVKRLFWIKHLIGRINYKQAKGK